MTSIAFVSAQIVRAAAPVYSVSLERAVVSSSPVCVVPEVTAVCTQGSAIAVASVVMNRPPIVHQMTSIALQIAPVGADIACVRPDIATIRPNIAGVVTNVASCRRNGCLGRGRGSDGCDTNCHCGA